MTEYGYCPRCDERVELVPHTIDRAVGADPVLGCHKCGNLMVTVSRIEYRRQNPATVGGETDD